MTTIKPIETIYNGYRFRSRLEARWAVFFDALGIPYEYEPEGFDLGEGQYYLPDFRLKCYGTRETMYKRPFDLWVEVKGRMSREDSLKIKEFAGYRYEPELRSRCPLGYKGQNLLLSARSDYDDHERRWTCLCGREVAKYGSYVPSSFMCDLVNPPVEIHCGHWAGVKNSILVVGDIPHEGCAFDSMSLGSYDYMDEGVVYPFNFETVDGDYFPAYPGIREGKFFLCGGDSNYIWNIEQVEKAYAKARQARFEHGETPAAK